MNLKTNHASSWHNSPSNGANLLIWRNKCEAISILYWNCIIINIKNTARNS